MTYGRYAVNREGIAEDLKEAMVAILANYSGPGVPGVGFPNQNIFWADNAASLPQSGRPFVSFTISNTNKPHGYADIRRFLVPEDWRVQVTSAADGTYTVTIDGVGYSYPASGDTVDSIRDGLITSIGTPTNVLAVTPIDNDTIKIEGDNPGYRLHVSASPASLIVTRPRKTVISRTYKRVRLPVRIRCFGKYDLDDPQAEQGGRAIAEQLEWGLTHADIMAKMRSHQHVFSQVLQMPDLGGVFDKEYRSLGGLDLLLRTTGHMDATMDQTTSVTITGTLTNGGQTSTATAPLTGGTPWS